ncbi:hypothetical protein BS50DRAFT_582074 [Corynespora cassiicola Philippines]|uniref:Uncharacterized protein n=1 Tax=Corynespora cassiicola Philippines TaxID=1448308 RepID=A0A2T2PCV8_CORCC|nr:hypothetical protein BS50DRAFT_582074 [Corynespora cassiicola Philippines]
MSSTIFKPFFELTNYDVRFEIYQHLQGGQVCIGDDYKGLILSCQQIYHETRHVSSRALLLYLKRVKEEFDHKMIMDIQLPILTPSTLMEYIRNVIFTIPVLGERDPWLPERLPPTRRGGWRNVPFILSSLLNKPFDSVTILFYNDRVNMGDEELDRIEKITDEFATNILGAIMKDLAQCITWSHNQETFYDAWNSYEPVLPEDGNLLADMNSIVRVNPRLPPKPINTKKIQLAWDLRNEEEFSTEITMRGLEWSYSKAVERRLRKLLKKNKQPQWPKYHELQSQDGLVGIRSLYSPQRWAPYSEEEVPLLFDQSGGFLPCSSNGVFYPPEQGLKGMTLRQLDKMRCVRGAYNDHRQHTVRLASERCIRI